MHSGVVGEGWIVGQRQPFLSEHVQGFAPLFGGHVAAEIVRIELFAARDVKVEFGLRLFSGHAVPVDVLEPLGKEVAVVRGKVGKLDEGPEFPFEGGPAR